MRFLTDDEFDAIFKEIKQVFKAKDYILDRGFNFNSFRLTGKNDQTHIYCRVHYDEVLGVIIDLNNIFIDESIQRKGLFSKLIDRLYNCEIVGTLIISSVMTESMHKFCRKHDFAPYPQFGGYIKTKDR